MIPVLRREALQLERGVNPLRIAPLHGRVFSSSLSHHERGSKVMQAENTSAFPRFPRFCRIYRQGILKLRTCGLLE